MPRASYFGGEIEIDPFVREAYKKLPIVEERYLGLFAELLARHWNDGHVWRAILKDGVPADFLKPDEKAVERENFDFDPGDEDDEPTYRDAREDFEELCDGINAMAMRAVHAEKNAGHPLRIFPACKWVALPLTECRAARRNDGRQFPRDALPPLPAEDCDLRFCACSWMLRRPKDLR